jgi:hypothetical protein
MHEKHEDDELGFDLGHEDADMERALTQALRAEDPGAAFTQRILAKAREERTSRRQVESARALPPAATSAPAATAHARLTRSGALRKWVAAAAATITLTAAGAQWMQHRRYVAEGERARAQVLAALRLTNQKLNIVHDRITDREGAR